MSIYVAYAIAAVVSAVFAGFVYFAVKGKK